MTIGQYLRPTPRHHEVVRYVEPATFAAWERAALGMGFLYAASGPLVRSSYRAAEVFVRSLLPRDGSPAAHDPAWVDAMLRARLDEARQAARRGLGGARRWGRGGKAPPRGRSGSSWCPRRPSSGGLDGLPRLAELGSSLPVVGGPKEPAKPPMTAADKGLLERVARGISRPGLSAPTGVTSSILAQAARSYGARPILDEATVPTGFDPAAAALFEAIIEAAFLVANSDGVFDDEERAAFESVVTTACFDQVQPAQLQALLADLCEQLALDGIEKRARMVGRTITRRDHQLEVLRIAALMAHISGGVSEPELSVLAHLAHGFDLGPGAVDHALAEAQAALSNRTPRSRERRAMAAPARDVSTRCVVVTRRVGLALATAPGRD